METQPIPVPSVRRPRKVRCKTGCLYCRLRRKKCDEQKPICNSCTRLGLLCSWPDPSEFAWRIRMGLPSEQISTKTQRGPGQRSASPTTPPSNTASSLPVTYPIPHLAGPSPGLFPFSESMSLNLLQLYVEQTTSIILSSPRSFRDPLIHDVVPRAFEDPLIMDAIMSVGGIPMREQSDNGYLEAKRLQHYGSAIRELKFALTDWSNGSRQDPLRLLLTTTLLCQHEILHGNKQGVFRYHIRACRQFARHICATPIAPPDNNLAQVLLEMYAYLELSSSLHLTANSLDLQVASQSALATLSSVRQSSTFGLLFGSASSLYEMIPDIRRLADNRRRELTLDIDLGCESTFNHLRQLLLDFNWDAALTTGPTSDQTSFVRGKAAAGLIVQNSLLLFLYSSFYSDNQLLRCMACPVVDSAIEAIKAIDGTVWKNPTYWPIVVIGSYACTEHQQQEVLKYLKPRLYITLRAREVLHWLWESPDDVFGLVGLAKVVEENGASYCFG